MNRTILAGVVAAAAIVGCSTAPTVSSDQVASVYKRDFHSRGQAKADRVVQDEVQKACTDSDNSPSEALAKRLEAQEMSKIRFPSGSLMGDWKRGQKIAQSGRGMTWSDKAGAENGGSCYNCHQLSPGEDSYGTLGPSLRAFGKTRGYTPEMQKYAYGKIYNAKAYNLCSPMPRMGHSGTLTEQQMKDLTAYLMDANSPVNK